MHQHQVYDTDNHFVIDPITKEIINQSEKMKLMLGDHNSERFTFEIPRYIDGHDMTLCDKIEIHYINIDSKTKESNKDVYRVNDMQLSPNGEDVVIFSWLISGNATQLAGTLNFRATFKCISEPSIIDYQMSTEIFKGITVSDGISNSEAVIEQYSDVLEQWKQELNLAGEYAQQIQQNASKIDELNNDLSESRDYVNKIINYEINWNDGGYISKDDGSVKSETGSSYSDFVAVMPGTKLIITNTMTDNNEWNAFYDANKTFLSSFSNATGEVIVPDGAVKMRLSKYSTATITIASNIKSYIDDSIEKVEANVKLTDDAVNELKGDIVNMYGDETISEYKLNWIENEYVNGNTGEITTYNGWKRTDYTEIKKDFPLYFTTNQTTDNEYGAYYDENKNYVGKLYITANSDRAINQAPANAKYFIISCANNITTKAYCDTITIKHLYEKVNELENKINPYMLPEYYDSYMVEKNNKVNNLMDSINNCVSFAFITDQHLYSNAKNSGYMIKNIIENTPIRDVINGGDVISAYGTEESIYDDCSKYHKYWGFLNPYFVRGNHDIYASPSDDMTNGVIKSNSMVINRFIRPYKHDDMVIEEGRTYYYFDRPQNKVRFICLDTTEVIEKENTNVKFSITQTQIDWFVNLLKNTPSGYKIIVCNHIPINYMLLWKADFVLIFGDIIEAFNAKTTINTQSFNVSVNTDFSNTNGKVILSISGHGHVDSYHTSDSGCVYYEANCDCMINNGGSPYERVEGTVSEQSFDVFIINADNGDIYTIKYGAGIDRTLISH